MVMPPPIPVAAITVLPAEWKITPPAQVESNAVAAFPIIWIALALVLEDVIVCV